MRLPKDLRTASFQSPSSLRRVAFGPRVVTGFDFAGLDSSSATQTPQKGTTGGRYIMRLPSALRIAKIVRSPSLSLRPFHMKSNCQM